ncbi:MAG: hypothetical protein ACI4RD_07180 [Kiritimatiellia bacterium]
MKEFQQNLVAAWRDYAAGKIDAKTLKGASAGFGIYEQRNGKAMMRVRRVAGRISTDDLRSVAALLRRHGGDFAHLTTRQDIQLHGIPAAEVPAALEACEAAGFRFRGGGGDTFRNTLVSPYSGLSSDSVFDVAPYARALSDAFYGFDLAYGLPRKLKIAFADRPADAWLAQTNDLGFVAKIADGEPVFETYLAGGIGFKPRLGVRLFDALPAAECIRVAMALAALFHDKGCRTNRSHARIRFLREDFGDEGLIRLFHEYYARVPADAPRADAPAGEPPPVTAFPAEVAAADGFPVWRQLAVSPLARGLVAVRIFVPFGNFTADELETFAAAMEPFNARRFEILPSLDLGIAVPEAQLPGLYAALLGTGRDYVARSFAGNIRTCIGCAVCKSGVTDAPEVGRRIGEYFDAKYRPLDTAEKLAVARALLDDVRISGCPNSCTCHPLAKFGFAGRKLNGADAETTFTPGSLRPAAFGAADASVPVTPAAEFPPLLERRILASLRGKEAANV